jgi:hypothetical protein
LRRDEGPDGLTGPDDPFCVHTTMTLEDDEVLFADRAEWADVTPLEQYDSEGLSPLAPIIYTVECAFYDSGGGELIIMRTDGRYRQTKTHRITFGGS